VLRLGNPGQGPSRVTRVQTTATSNETRQDVALADTWTRGRSEGQKQQRTHEAGGWAESIPRCDEASAMSQRCGVASVTVHGELGRQACALKHRPCALTTSWLPNSQAFVSQTLRAHGVLCQPDQLVWQGRTAQVTHNACCSLRSRTRQCSAPHLAARSPARTVASQHVAQRRLTFQATQGPAALPAGPLLDRTLSGAGAWSTRRCQAVRDWRTHPQRPRG
jgi:hypothetical protein